MEWTVKPCSRDAVRRVAEALQVGETTAAILVRRGYDDVADAREHLEGALPGHDPFTLGHVQEACDAIHAAIAAGRRMCVHGDYDVDGICATALAVLVLRELGGDVEWHLPSRFEEGYGLSGQTLSRLAGEGCGLVLTVDCGITAVEEIREAKEQGLDVVVTDHHRPAETLPDCPIVATKPSAYPFPELCGTGVVFKLAQALLGPDSEFLERQLDLVALATIADVVPLVDENRALAIAGLKRLARTQRPGLQALMRTAHVDPARVNETAVGFRLAPRINAAGRLGSPQAALELLLTDDRKLADELARRLEELNRDRQVVEERILREAIAKVESWPEPARRRRGYVLADESWHEGVIGIVASRLVERYARPVVLVAGTAEGDWKGSGRSITSFDLHGALAACAGHLERFGGHRAAAGLSIRPDRVDAFTSAFAAHADAFLSEEELRSVTVVDAVVRGSELTLDLCAELARLAPFGLGNPGINLLVGGCELFDPATVGDGKHLRFRVRDAGRDAGCAIAFGYGAQADRLRREGLLYDVAFRLEANHWNGTMSPQLVVRRFWETPGRYPELARRLREEWQSGPDGWSDEAGAVFAELGLAWGEPATRRSLLESELFRALIDERPELAQAA